MFVKSQDGAVVLNNDKVTEYSTDSKYDGRYKVAALVGESRVVIGRYSTKEKCRMAISMLMRIDRNGTRERFLVWYGELRRVRYQDNWRNLSTRTARNQKAVEWFMENKPDISYRTFMSNMDDELLKSFHVELKEVWE